MRNPIKIFQAWNLNRRQKKINNEYEEQGLTDEILDKQLELNAKRAELNLPDKTKIINDEGFVQ